MDLSLLPRDNVKSHFTNRYIFEAVEERVSLQIQYL